MTAYEQNGKEYEIDYDLDNRIIKVDVDNNDVEKYRRLVGILDLESEANVARRVSSREASLNQCAEHKHQAGQTVIQNDIMAHPSRLNSVIARAVDGSKFKLEWYHKNYLDHAYAVSDDDGDILEHYRYTAFGEVQIYNASGNQLATTQIDNHILWNTRRRDEVTGYYMYKYRHYSAELGRWPGRDPIEEDGGVNLYGFCYNSPLNWWDNTGKTPNYISPTMAPYIDQNGDGISDWRQGELLPPKPDQSKDIKTYNCAGLAFGTYGIHINIVEIKDALDKKCKKINCREPLKTNNFSNSTHFCGFR